MDTREAVQQIRLDCRLIELYQLTACPVCGGNDWRDCLLVHAPPYECAVTNISSVKYVVCRCGTLFLDRYIKDLDEYYKSTYRKTTEENNENVTPLVLDKELERANRLVPAILSRTSPQKIMDVGSSTGTLLSQFSGCTCIGIEPSTAYRAYSNNNGVKTYNRIEKVEGIFDLITCIHVLEHIISPIEFLKEITGRGNRDTLYLFEVPFFDFRLNHPLLYTMAVLEMVLKKAGLMIVDVVPGDDLTVFART